MTRLLVVDLCDTLVRTAGMAALLRVPGIAPGWDAAGLERWLRANPLYYAYERGQADTAAFVGALGQTLAPQLPRAQVADAYEALVVAAVPGMEALLQQLHGSVQLVALSNCNPLLWRGIQRVSPSLTVFQQLFLSHETGLLKPEPAAFTAVLAATGTAARDALLIDDNPACVQAAVRLGMAGHRFVSAGRLRRELVRRGVLAGAALRSDRASCVNMG